MARFATRRAMSPASAEARVAGKRAIFEMSAAFCLRARRLLRAAHAAAAMPLCRAQYAISYARCASFRYCHYA